MRDLDDLFAALARSAFRGRFRLRPAEAAYLARKTLAVVLDEGRGFLRERLAPAEPKNDGRQTPWRGHPIFVAQHATATCCRGCLAKWHGIARGRPLDGAEIEHVLAAWARWLAGQPCPPTESKSSPATADREETGWLF
ncbi:MAG: DUF4186 domain-containing protein [Pirellulales bacterium]|nr:DUF4186 domain-containing protein [Pirellulales bacterium]